MPKRQIRQPSDPGPLADVVDAIAYAGIDISNRIRRARINDDIGELESVNVQGEVQEKLDVISDETILHHLKNCSSVGVYGSEEQNKAVVIRSVKDGGQYCVLSDPLDGSSNIGVAAGVGTIFSVLPNTHDGADSTLQAGSSQVAAGYILYGSSTLMVLATCEGVDMYVLDPDKDSFIKVIENIKLPGNKKIYSINEAYTELFDIKIKEYLNYTHKNGYSARYIGSMVADVHRTLIKGGVFIYPATVKAKEGKLRLMYEANPMAYIIEQAGGKATCGKERIIDVIPNSLHQRIPLILGSCDEVDQVTQRLE